jgi:hypothetical protein
VVWVHVKTVELDELLPVLVPVPEAELVLPDPLPEPVPWQFASTVLYCVWQSTGSGDRALPELATQVRSAWKSPTSSAVVQSPMSVVHSTEHLPSATPVGHAALQSACEVPHPSVDVTAPAMTRVRSAEGRKRKARERFMGQ